jgi:hypothetical protein
MKPIGLAIAAVACAGRRGHHAGRGRRVPAGDRPGRAGLHRPGRSYRSIYDARRGEVFEVIERGTRGYWYRIVLEDGTTGWIFGELVFPFEVGPTRRPAPSRAWAAAIRRAILGPSPLPYADVEVSFSAGLLDREGLFLLRPAWVIDPYFAIEGFAGLSPRAQTDVFLGRRRLDLAAGAGRRDRPLRPRLGRRGAPAAQGRQLHRSAEETLAVARRWRRLRDHVQEADHRAHRLPPVGAVRTRTAPSRATSSPAAWRSSSSEALMLRTLSFVVAVVLATGCGRFAVRPNEKEHLADPIMTFDQDPQESAADDHVLTNREGAAGGTGTGGGGCGCN